MKCTEALKVMFEAEDNPQKVKPSPEAAAHLEECPNCQRLLKWDSSIKETIRQKGMEKAVPAGLTSRISAEIRHQESLSWKEKLTWLLPGKPWGWVGVATAMAVILGIIGIRTMTGPMTSRFVAWCFEEHQEYVEEGFDLDIVSSDPAAVDEWFQKTIGKNPEVSRFLSSGLTLIGGKKMEFSGMNSALGCFKQGEVLVSLYAIPSNEVTIEGLSELKQGGRGLWAGKEDDLNQIVWIDEIQSITYSLVGLVSQEQLLKIVRPILKE